MAERSQLISPGPITSGSVLLVSAAEALNLYHFCQGNGPSSLSGSECSRRSKRRMRSTMLPLEARILRRHTARVLGSPVRPTVTNISLQQHRVTTGRVSWQTEADGFRQVSASRYSWGETPLFSAAPMMLRPTRRRFSLSCSGSSPNSSRRSRLILWYLSNMTCGGSTSTVLSSQSPGHRRSFSFPSYPAHTPMFE